MVKKHPVKMLLDSRATRNFISDVMATTFNLQVQSYDNFHDLKLADRAVVQIAGYV